MASLGSAVFFLACSSTGGREGQEEVSQVQSGLASGVPYVYFECNATGWNPGAANLLQPTSNPSIFTLSYSVTQSWLVSSPDQCLIVATNQLDGSGTFQVYYSVANPSVPVSVPGGAALIDSTANFAVSYPATGNYMITLDTQQNTFSIVQNTGIIGDCGLGKEGNPNSDYVDYVLVYSSNLTRWCVDANWWAISSNAAAISQFFTYGDAFIAQLESQFHVTLAAPFSVEVTNVTGGACATCSDFGFGERVTGDAFSNVVDDPVSGTPIPGFYGYLLPVHEAINSFTGTETTFAGWPADWWADHRSPFPNMLDEFEMRAVGTELNNATLLAAATAQHEIWNDPGLPNYDPEVVMFDTIYDQYGAFTPFGNLFTLTGEDGLVEHTVDSGTNPSPLLTEYVIAYLQLGMHTTTDLTQSLFVASGVGTEDTTISPYTVSSSAVLAIADAHCSIRAASAAGVNVSTQLSALQSGDYASAIAGGGTAAACPAECIWNTTTATCVAPW